MDSQQAKKKWPMFHNIYGGTIETSLTFREPARKDHYLELVASSLLRVLVHVSLVLDHLDKLVAESQGFALTFQHRLVVALDLERRRGDCL
jgi:hypothetical protein